jgi:hypothetical protein
MSTFGAKLRGTIQRDKTTRIQVPARTGISRPFSRPEEQTNSAKGAGQAKIELHLKRPSPFLQRLLGRRIEPDSIDENDLPEGIMTVLADKPQQALAAALRCRPLVYDQIAALMGLSRDRVRQLETRAAATLRRASRFRQLCRFIPGWHNALRFPPDDAGCVLPGETIPLKFSQKPRRQFNARAKLAFELTLARWERLGRTHSHGQDEDSIESQARLQRQRRLDAIFSLKHDALEWNRNRKIAGNFKLCDMFLDAGGEPPCRGCPINEITGASHCKHTPLADALSASRLGLNHQQFQSAAGRMAEFMRNLWTKTNGLRKRIRSYPARVHLGPDVFIGKSPMAR